MPTPNEENLFGNIFDDPKYSDEHFSEYFDKSMALMAGNNIGGRFNAILSASAPVKLAWDTVRGLESSDLVHQLIGTKGENMSIKSGLDFIREKESFLETTLVGQPLIFDEFIPRGMGEYTHADKGEIHALFQRFRDRSVQYVGTTGVPFQDACIAMVTDYETAHGTHSTTMGAVSGDHSNDKKCRTAVESQAMSNLRATAEIFPQDITSCLIYHPFRILKSIASHPHIKKPGSLIVGQTFFVMEGIWEKNIRIRLRAMTGDLVGGSISIAILNLATSPMPVDSKKVKNPRTHSFSPADLQTNPTDTCLILKSNNSSLPCLYELEIYYVNE